ncbi:MAG: hypothetical protein ACI8VT_003745, partial [Saprospiraceae bacterium]
GRYLLGLKTWGTKVKPSSAFSLFLCSFITFTAKERRKR